MLGTDVCNTLAEHGIEHTAVGRDDLDLMDQDAVADRVSGHVVVVNCAAWTAVDEAETCESHAFDVNATAPGLLARAARLHDARIVHVSTDYVFGGDARSPYDEDAPLQPRSAYGRTKAAGEWAVRAEAPGRHFVLRTGWLYGAHGDCFPRTIARVAEKNGAVEVVDDQFGQPTWTRDVAELMVRLVQADAPAGTWHTTSSGETSWWGFAREVVAAAGLSPDIVTPTHSKAVGRAAVRPAYSVLGHRRLLEHDVEPIGPWQQRWSVAAQEVLAASDVLAVDQLD
ncbi:MAG: dTDP-4-dehydrorhamnose reductase [Nocardioidaceae bacterium]|nr:dTDP-4-dehydrorhamnose reductase [Nocardioidaceae bacterium]